MSISELEQDMWQVTTKYGVPYSIYNYYLNEDLYTADENLNTSVIAHCPSVISVQYTPFLDINDIALARIPYDNRRYGSVEKIRPEITGGNAYVYRIITESGSDRKLGEFSCYPTKPNTIGGKRDWRNESKLYHYPYSFAMITDYFNPPITIKYHLCKGANPEIWVKNTISDRSTYSIYVPFYKNDRMGKLEGNLSSGGNELPCSSSAYAQFYASNKNQMAHAVNMASQQAFLSTKSAQQNGIMGMLGSLNFTNPLGSIGGVLGNYLGMNQNIQQANLNKQDTIGGVLAQQNDMQSTPNTMISQGSDIMYGLVNGENRLDLFKYTIQEEYAKKIGDYFAMYGYKVNKVFTPYTRSRYYYNYVKTIGCNIYSEGVPKEFINELKAIFDSGVTIWHIDREGVVVGDYSNDNYEI